MFPSVKIPAKIPCGPQAVGGLFFFLALGYLAQFTTLAPNAADEALTLDYIQLVARGAWPHWDFIDLYGPLNWVFPALAYRVSGELVLGIRLWLLVLKLAVVVLSYGLTASLSNRFYGFLTAALMTVVLGQPWPYFQIAYSFTHSFPLVLLTWRLLLLAPETARPRRHMARLGLAGLLTGGGHLDQTQRGAVPAGGWAVLLFPLVVRLSLGRAGGREPRKSVRVPARRWPPCKPPAPWSIRRFFSCTCAPT